MNFHAFNYFPISSFLFKFYKNETVSLLNAFLFFLLREESYVIHKIAKLLTSDTSKKHLFLHESNAYQARVISSVKNAFLELHPNTLNIPQIKGKTN